MTTIQNDELLVTSCPDHGVKVVGNFETLAAYVEIAREDDFGWVWDNSTQTVTRTAAAARFDAQNGTDPWRCCWHMVIDPDGVCDY